jgi:hypothetical protein
MSSLVRIDDITLGDHSKLTYEDCCYFLTTYTAGKKSGHSLGNRLIINSKKTLDRRGLSDWPYKGLAMNEISTILKTALPPVVDFAKTTFVPIPPSKIQTNPLYDDRIEKIIRNACPNHADIRQLIRCKSDMEAAHTGYRPTIEELINNYYLPDTIDPNPKETIVIFDDVITAGCHYIAAKTILKNAFPDSNIMGIFVARREILRTSPFDDFFDM